MSTHVTRALFLVASCSCHGRPLRGANCTDRSGKPALSILPVHGAIWAPRRAADALTLNAEGSHSDGLPAQLRSEKRVASCCVLVAEVLVATGDAGGVATLSDHRNGRGYRSVARVAGRQRRAAWQGESDGIARVFVAGVRVAR